jgi:hypothetical protein
MSPSFCATGVELACELALEDIRYEQVRNQCKNLCSESRGDRIRTYDFGAKGATLEPVDISRS